MKPCICIIALLALLPHHLAAYQTTEQTAHKVNETTALYSITFTMGHSSADIKVPVRGVNGFIPGESDAFGFAMYADSRDLAVVGNASAMNYSDAPIIDGMYYVPAGSNSTFTIRGIFTTPAEAIEDDYALKITHLPFLIGEEELLLELNLSELDYYITPEVELNTGNFTPKQ